MIRLSMMCVPQGIGMLRFDILSGSIWTSDDNQFHHYHLTMADDVTHSGRIPKTFSAHQNPFLILGAIYQDIQNNDGC